MEMSHTIVESDSDNGTSLSTREEGEERSLWSSVSSIWALAISPRSNMVDASFSEFTPILDRASAAEFWAPLTYWMSDVNCEM